MNATQPQLIQTHLNNADVVFTPDWVAKDMVEWFKPSGTILEPSSGDGVFLEYLPAGTEWCEINKGRDFFKWDKRVDWIVGNPPYGIFADWLRYSFNISNNIVYLIPINKPYNSGKLLQQINKWGSIKHIRYYANGAALGFPIGFAIGAIHFSKSATCTTYSSYNDLA